MDPIGSLRNLHHDWDVFTALGVIRKPSCGRVPMPESRVLWVRGSKLQKDCFWILLRQLPAPVENLSLDNALYD